MPSPHSYELVDVDGQEVLAELGPESFVATCLGDIMLGGTNECGRKWTGKGTLQSRHARARAQAHADRMTHVIDVQHTNPR